MGLTESTIFVPTILPSCRLLLSLLYNNEYLHSLHIQPMELNQQTVRFLSVGFGPLLSNTSVAYTMCSVQFAVYSEKVAVCWVKCCLNFLLKLVKLTKKSTFFSNCFSIGPPHKNNLSKAIFKTEFIIIPRVPAYQN